MGLFLDADISPVRIHIPLNLTATFDTVSQTPLNPSGISLHPRLNLQVDRMGPLFPTVKSCKLGIKTVAYSLILSEIA